MDQDFETQASKDEISMPSDTKSIGPSSSSEHQTSNRLIDEIAAFNKDGLEKSIIDVDAKQNFQVLRLRVTRQFAQEVTSFVRNEPPPPLKPVLGAVDEDVDTGDTDESSLYRASDGSTNEDAASEGICYNESERSAEA